MEIYSIMLLDDIRNDILSASVIPVQSRLCAPAPVGLVANWYGISRLRGKLLCGTLRTMVAIHPDPVDSAVLYG
jgi:hypothetical protein